MDGDARRTDLSVDMVVVAVSDTPIPTEAIERQLDRTQAFIPRVDTRVSAFFAISSAQVALALINLTATDLIGWVMLSCLFVFLGCTLWAMLNIYQCIHPNLINDRSSILYFSDISRMSVDNFTEQFNAIGDGELRRELCQQIWRNSQIVTQKYNHLKKAASSILFGTLPWLILLLGSSVTNFSLPSLP